MAIAASTVFAQVSTDLFASRLVKLGKQPVSFAFGARSYVQHPAGGPDWGLSFTATFPYPK